MKYLFPNTVNIQNNSLKTSPSQNGNLQNKIAKFPAKDIKRFLWVIFSTAIRMCSMSSTANVHNQFFYLSILSIVDNLQTVSILQHLQKTKKVKINPAQLKAN